MPVRTGRTVTADVQVGEFNELLARRSVGRAQDFNAMDKSDGSAESWIATFTKQLRTQLPKGQFILSHARKSSRPCVPGDERGADHVWQ